MSSCSQVKRCPDTKIAYKTYGTLNADKSNVILCLVFWGGRHTDCEYFMAEGGAIDPAKYFIVIPNLTGNTLSSSPSNTPPPHDGPRFPVVTIYDNVQLQRRLLTEVLGIEKIALAFGHSMGAVQTFHWGCALPRHGGAPRAHLRRLALRGSRQRVSRRHEGGAQDRPGVARR